jgi:cyclic pyranopterin phosphate synthase
LRLSVTDRCNLRCLYCRGDHGPPLVSRPETLSYEETLDLVARIHHNSEIHKLRLTGGEPLVRAELCTLIRGLRGILPHAELCLTTNGTLLAKRAADLAAAGLDRVNVSLDTTDTRQFAALTRGGSLDSVLDGLTALTDAGFSPVKINAVLLRSFNGAHLADIARLAAARGCEVRFVELMPVGEAAELFAGEYLSARDALALLSQSLTHVGELGRQGTAIRHLFRDNDTELTIGFITSVSQPFCATCDRVRLDCRGRLYSCLRHEQGIDLMTPLRSGLPHHLDAAIRSALPSKPARACTWPATQMARIGG